MIVSTLFSSARFKLTLGYTLFFAAVFIFFSTLMYQVQVRTLERTRAIPPRLLNRIEQRLEKRAPVEMRDYQLNADDDPARALAQERVDMAILDLKTAVFRALLVVNVGAIFLGAVVAYLLAGYSLRPLEEAYQKQKQFLQDVSHELRTPLSVMQVELDVAERQVTTHKTTVTRGLFQQTVSSLREEVKLMSKLVADILQLSRMEQLETAAIDSTSDLRKVVNNVVAQFQVIADEKKITLKLSDTTEATQPLIVAGEAEQWQQVLRILVDNALKYSNEKDTVTITLSTQPHHVVVRVQDTSMGISAQDLKKIFERFYRADKARSSSGTGLGLAIAKELANQLGATITARSKVGEGSSFEVKALLV
jgi:signal transduction histidine kinase